MTDHILYRQMMYDKIIDNKKYGKLIGLAGIELNVTELCNRKCVFCPRHDPKVYPNLNKHMSTEVIEKLISELQKNEYKGVIYFSGFGEPLLCKDIIKHIIKVKEELPDCFVEMTTNGDHLTVSYIEQIRDHIDNIIIDCYDSAEQKHQKITMLQELNFTKYKIRELWLKDDEDISGLMNEINFNNRAGAVKNIDFKVNTNQQCFLPFYRITIDWNGDVLLCCNDWFRLQKNLRNILTTSFYDIWFSDVLQNVRKNLLNGKRVDPACKQCSVKGTLLGNRSVELINQHFEK